MGEYTGHVVTQMPSSNRFTIFYVQFGGTTYYIGKLFIHFFPFRYFLRILILILFPYSPSPSPTFCTLVDASEAGNETRFIRRTKNENETNVKFQYLWMDGQPRVFL